VRFYLGTHMTEWAKRPGLPPLFLNRRRLLSRPVNGPAAGRYAIDLGSFTELLLFGRWSVTPAQAAAQVAGIADRLGEPDWVTCADWMCEPVMLGRTGLSVAEHQRRTTESYLELAGNYPRFRWVPVLQGYAPAEYLAHVEQYARSGVDLAALPTVGVGSVCRRQSSDVVEAVGIIRSLAALGLSLHAFGFKTTALPLCHHLLASADSMAWSDNARRNPPLPGCTHRRCTNCLRRALWWHDRLMKKILLTHRP
jgi:hypothetical protein